jgi:FkbM family methyltransferase
VIARRLKNAIDRVPVLRSAVRSRSGQYLVQTARGAGAVRERLRFAVRQLGLAPAGTYRLSDSGLHIILRHERLFASGRAAPPTGDVQILIDIFGGRNGHHGYEPPHAIAAALDDRSALRALDLGGNIGLFGAYVFGRWPSASIKSYEPDPANLAVLTRVIAANRLEDRWSVAEVAAANYTGEMTFVAGMFAESHAVTKTDGSSPRGNGQTITVPAVDIFEEDHDVDLMKIDIEGGEWSILTDPRLGELRADFLIIEWHERGAPEPDARGAAARLLRAAGYGRQEEVDVSTHKGALWAWREGRVGSG